MISIGARAHTIKELYEVIEYKLPFVEMSLDNPETSQEWMPELIKIKNRYGIYFLAHYPNEDNPFDPGILRERFLPRIKTLIDLSCELEISKATMHFWIDSRWSPKGLIPQKIDLLKEIVEYASGHGIIICLENLTERHDSFKAAFDSCEDLRMTLDIGHAQLLAKVNTSYGYIEHFPDRIEHIHVHDNNGGTSVKDDLHLALGDGKVDYEHILSSLLDTGYDSTITMEVKPSDMPRTIEAIQRCRAFLDLKSLQG